MPQRSDPGARVVPGETAHARLRRDTEDWHRAVEDAFAGLDLTRRGDLARFLAAQAEAVLPLEAELDHGGIADLVPDWPTRRRSDALRADIRLLGDATRVGIVGEPERCPPAPRRREGWHADGRDGWGPPPQRTLAGIPGTPTLFVSPSLTAEAAPGMVPTPRPSGGTIPGAGRDENPMTGAPPAMPVPEPTTQDSATPGHRLGALYVLEGSRLGGRLLARRVAASADPVVAQATGFLAHPVRQGAWAGFIAILNAAAVEQDDLVQGAVAAFRRFHDGAMRA